MVIVTLQTYDNCYKCWKVKYTQSFFSQPILSSMDKITCTFKMAEASTEQTWHMVKSAYKTFTLSQNRHLRTIQKFFRCDVNVHRCKGDGGGVLCWFGRRWLWNHPEGQTVSIREQTGSNCKERPLWRDQIGVGSSRRNQHFSENRSGFRQCPQLWLVVGFAVMNAKAIEDILLTCSCLFKHLLQNGPQKTSCFTAHRRLFRACMFSAFISVITVSKPNSFMKKKIQSAFTLYPVWLSVVLFPHSCGVVSSPQVFCGSQSFQRSETGHN